MWYTAEAAVPKSVQARASIESARIHQGPQPSVCLLGIKYQILSEAASLPPGLWPGGIWARVLASGWRTAIGGAEVFQYFNSWYGFLGEYCLHFRPEWKPDFEELGTPS